MNEESGMILEVMPLFLSVFFFLLYVALLILHSGFIHTVSQGMRPVRSAPSESPPHSVCLPYK